MKCIGFLSAGEPDTTALYWRLFHEEIRRRTKLQHTGRVVAESLDAAELVNPHGRNRRAGRWLADAAQRVEKHGAQGVLLCSSSLHVHARVVRDAVDVPVLHIAMATAEKLRRVRLGPPALIGLDRPSGEERIWQAVLAKGGIKETVLPSDLDGAFVQDQLKRGLNLESATEEIRAAFTRLSVDLKHAGARVIVLTRPELAFGLREEDSVLPTLCAVHAHCELAARFALEGVNGDSLPGGALAHGGDEPRDARE